MDERTFVRISFGIVFVSVFTAVCVADSCPSPAVIYASEGDNVTICWELLQHPVKSKDLTRFTVMTLFRPVEEEMKKVASANNKGQFFRTYNKHDGLYMGKATVDADLRENKLFFRIVNYTSMMENVYCVFYEMTGSNDIQTCHAQAIFLRNFAAKEYTTNIPSTETTVTTVKAPATHGERASTPQSYKIAFIAVVSVIGVLTVLTVVAFVLYCRARNSR